MANLTLRSVKGSALTMAEMDGNFEYFTGSYTNDGIITAQGFDGTASYATQALSSSFALNAPNYLPLQGGVMSGEISAPLLTVSNGAYGPIRLVDDYVAGEAGLIAADDTAIAIIYQDGTYRYGGAVGSEPLQISGSTIKITSVRKYKNRYYSERDNSFVYEVDVEVDVEGDAIFIACWATGLDIADWTVGCQ